MLDMLETLQTITVHTGPSRHPRAVPAMTDDKRSSSMPLPRCLRRRIVPAIPEESDNATRDTYSDNATPDADNDQLVWPRRFKQLQPAANKPVGCRSVLSGVFTTY
jgi:hypothetical protein